MDANLSSVQRGLHWNDRRSLAAAVAIAARNRVAFGEEREWSRNEGHRKG